MIETIWNFLAVHIEWQVYLIIFGFIVVGLAITAKVLGWQLPAPLLAALAITAAVVVALARATQKGYELRKVDENTADTKVTNEFKEIHKKDEGLSDAQLDQKNDPWLKP